MRGQCVDGHGEGVWGTRGPSRPGAGGPHVGFPLIPIDKAEIKRTYHRRVEQKPDSTDEQANRQWNALYGRARLMLDDDGVAQESRRKETAARKLKRAGLDAPPVDIALVKRTLLAYAATKRYSLALESTAATKDEMNLAYDLWPESKTVYEYVQRMRDEARSQDMEEVSDLAADKLKVLLRDDKGKCLVNAKLVMQTLERLDSKRFGEDVAKSNGAKRGGDGEPMVYQISNVQMNLIGGDAVRAALPSGGVVDVDAVVKALEGGGNG